MPKSNDELRRLATELRAEALKLMSYPGKGHVGGSMSLAEGMAVLYSEIMNVRPNEPHWPDRDKLVFSKGHCGPILYATLYKFGYLPAEYMTQMNRLGTPLPSHVNRLLTPGVDYSTGSLGQGLSVAAGMALADKHDGVKDRYIYCVMGDGECQEGQVWEAALFVATHNLEKLIIIVDDNKKQCSDYTENIIRIEPLEDKFAAFGFAVQRVDGHDPEPIREALLAAKKNTRPSVVILDTVKGKNCVFAETTWDNHHIPVSKENLEASLKHLETLL